LNLPLVSICIPNYNNEKYLDECIESALNIRYENIEIIFVDDCSTDASLEIAEKYSSYIHIYKNEKNLGQPKNTNKAISLASGDYIVILHSDDVLCTNFCEKLVPYLLKYPNAVMAVGERYETDETSIIHSIVPFYKFNCMIPGEKQAKVFMMMSFLPCQVLFKKSAFWNSGGVHEKHVVNLDGLLWFQISLQGDVIYVQDVVSVYRMHKDNTTSRYNKTINHMMEYYGTLSEMFRLARGRPYLEQFFSIAEKRVATLTIRYCVDVIKNRNYILAKQYLKLAEVFDSHIVDNEMYQLLHYCLNSEIDEPLFLYEKIAPANSLKRLTSYDPPDGYLKI